MDKFKLKSTLNTYKNAKVLRKCLVVDYMKLKITTLELINSIHICEKIIITNGIILHNNGLD